jgi:hypothetical protein
MPEIIYKREFYELSRMLGIVDHLMRQVEDLYERELVDYDDDAFNGELNKIVFDKIIPEIDNLRKLIYNAYINTQQETPNQLFNAEVIELVNHYNKTWGDQPKTWDETVTDEFIKKYHKLKRKHGVQ